jgi:flagellar hook-associated protein 2
MAMLKTFEIDGKKYSLSSFGISTQAYFSNDNKEKHAYHIDGDKDDEVSSGKLDKLKAAINENPDKVTEFFTQLSKELYSTLNEKMKATTSSSAFKIYNDKELDKDYKDYTKTISKWDDKIEYYENFYYDKFTAMEKALATLQSNSSSLTSLLGG